jgi:outer membrane protein TolC
MRFRTGWATGFIILTASAVGAAAQISLSSAVDLALRNDPRVNIAKADIAKAQANLAATHDVYVPNLIADGGYGQGFGVPTGLPVIFSMSSQSLVYNFSQRDNVRAASAALEAAKLALKETDDQVAEDVVVTYLNLDNAENRQAAIAKEYEIALRLATIVQERLDAGQDTRIELLRAQRNATEIQLEQIQTDGEAATLSDHLARLIGLPGNHFRADAKSIPAMPPIHALTGNEKESFGIQSAFAAAKVKQEYAFGLGRYLLRPQISLNLNYSRIDTSQNGYTQYYPQFANKSENAESVFIQIQIPLFDRKHRDDVSAAGADAAHARFEASNQRNQFLDNRFKLQHSTSELAAHSKLAEIDRDIAQEQLNAVLAQLSAGTASDDRPQLTPKDEQNARLQESARTIDLLNAQFQLNQALVNLLRQTGQLDNWLKTAAVTPTTAIAPPVVH